TRPGIDEILERFEQILFPLVLIILVVVILAQGHAFGLSLRLSCSAASARTSCSAAYDAAALAFWVARDPAATATRVASTREEPVATSAASVPQNASPAPVVSTMFSICGAGTRVTPSSSITAAPAGPRVTTQVRARSLSAAKSSSVGVS